MTILKPLIVLFQSISNNLQISSPNMDYIVSIIFEWDHIHIIAKLILKN
jgi:hypothetical protein